MEQKKNKEQKEVKRTIRGPRTREEFRAMLPKKLSKAGEWMVKNFVPDTSTQEERDDFYNAVMSL